MDRESESTYLLDMAACEPASAISPRFESGMWTAVDYATERGKGRMLFCGPDTRAPALRLKLDANGWYHIFVATDAQNFDGYCLLLKLSDDAGYTRATPETFRPEKDLVAPEMLFSETDLCEAYWKTADLAGQDIIFHRPAAGHMSGTVANVAYVRLVPLSEPERERARQLAPRPDTRRLIANYDGGQHEMWAYGTEQEMIDEFQALADADFGLVLWGCARSFAAYYPSKVASRVEWSPGMPGTRARRESVERARRHGFDALGAAVRCARNVGARIYPLVRMVGEFPPPHHLGYSGPGRFQAEHPEWRCLTAEGHRARHLSQAFPQVRAKYVQLFREWVEDYEADGVSIVFCRSWPYVLYEDPVVQSFEREYGEDMRALEAFDKRVLAHRASFLTQLLRETRQMLDEVGAARGQRLGTCYVLPADAYEPADCPDLGPFTTPLSLAMDVETWVEDGLVDQLVLHLEGVGAPDASDRGPLIQPYLELAGGTNTQVYPDLYPRRQSADSMRIRALACYEAGVDGLCFWDCQGRALRLSNWAMHRLLGHEEELAELKPFADRLFRIVPLIELDGFMAQNEHCKPTDG